MNEKPKQTALRIRGPHIYLRDGFWWVANGRAGRFSLGTRDEAEARAKFEALNLEPYRSPIRQDLRTGVVYFVRYGYEGPIKIGFATVLHERIRSLGTATPGTLRVLAAIPGTQALERRLHRAFVAHRQHGEWFAPGVVLEFLHAMADAAVGSLPPDVPQPRFRAPNRKAGGR